MPGWNLIEGVCSKQNPSDEEYWDALENLYNNTHKTATYKFCFLKSLLDCNLDNDKLEISFFKLFHRFTEIYWDLIVKYSLCQIYVNSQYQKSKAEYIIAKCISDLDGNKQSSIWDLPYEERTNLVQNIAHYCSQNVVGAFFDSTHGLFYSFSKKEKVLKLTQNSKTFLKRYEKEIDKVNYTNWAKMIEKINGTSLPTILATRCNEVN